MESSHIITLKGDLILRQKVADIWIEEVGTLRQNHVVCLSWLGSPKITDWEWSFVNRSFAERFRDDLIFKLCPPISSADGVDNVGAMEPVPVSDDAGAGIVSPQTQN